MKKYEDFSLKNISWIKIGGVAASFTETENDDEFISCLVQNISNGTNFHILGWGANTLINDGAISENIIKNGSNFISIAGKVEKNTHLEQTMSYYQKAGNIDARFIADRSKGTFRGIEFNDLDYDESNCERIRVKLSSGVGLPYAMNYLLEKGITGLQWFSGIPGTIGVAVYNNIHGGTHLFSENIYSIDIVDMNGKIRKIDPKEAGFEYDFSSLQTNKSIVVAVTLDLPLGDQKKAKYTVTEWAKRKSSQPRNSIGSIFKNIDQETKNKWNFPTTSTGYLIEHQLKLSGERIGDVMICPQANNFFVNLGNANSKDYLSIIRKVSLAAKEKFGITLIPEIFFLGFTKEELEGINL